MDKARLLGYFKKLGVAGFLFFLIKGLIWLFIIFGGARFIKGLFD